MREVWLRYRAADAGALGRAKRVEFTKTLSQHGVDGYGFANCTDAVYTSLLDGTAKQLKAKKGLPTKANLRDALSKDELVSVMAAETMARMRIENEKLFGNSTCEAATKRSAARLRNAIEEDKRDTQRPLI